MSALYVHDGGRVACVDHIGYSAEAEIKARPKARTVWTPLGTWERLTAADLTEEWASCETCRYEGARR